jgi:hypothetical protein
VVDRVVSVQGLIACSGSDAEDDCVVQLGPGRAWLVLVPDLGEYHTVSCRAESNGVVVMMIKKLTQFQ